MNGAIGFDGLLTGNINTGGTGTTDYNDLTNKPSINGVPLYGNKTSADLHLFTGDYDNLSNLPSINNVVLTGNKTTEDLGLFDGDYDHLTNKPTLFSGDYNDLTNKPTLFSGDYNDLTNKPTLFDGDYDSLNDRPQINGVTLTGDQTADDLGLFDGDYDHLTNKPTLFSGDYNDLYNKPTLFSGDYNDLTNKPTLFDGNYMSLTNRPYINGVALENNKTTSDLQISYNDLLDLPTIPGIEFNPADPATDEVETIDLDGTVYEVKDGDARAEISLLEDDIAPEYDATATYSTGDYCMYAGTIYEANTNISTPEAFTPGHWDATSAGEELSQIKSALSNIGFDYSNFRCFVKRPVNMDRFMAVIPCTTPLPTSVTVNSFQYMGNGWTSLTLDVVSIIGSSIVLQFNLPSGVTISNGLDYWAKGSVTLNYT